MVREKNMERQRGNVLHLALNSVIKHANRAYQAFYMSRFSSTYSWSQPCGLNKR